MKNLFNIGKTYFLVLVKNLKRIDGDTTLKKAQDNGGFEKYKTKTGARFVARCVPHE